MGAPLESVGACADNVDCAATSPNQPEDRIRCASTGADDRLATNQARPLPRKGPGCSIADEADSQHHDGAKSDNGATPQSKSLPQLETSPPASADVWKYLPSKTPPPATSTGKAATPAVRGPPSRATSASGIARSK